MGVVRLSLLSAARINDLVLAGARASQRVAVVAVASRDRRRVEAYARERGLPRAHGCYEALLASTASSASPAPSWPSSPAPSPAST